MDIIECGAIMCVTISAVLWLLFNIYSTEQSSSNFTNLVRFNKKCPLMYSIVSNVKDYCVQDLGKVQHDELYNLCNGDPVLFSFFTPSGLLYMNAHNGIVWVEGYRYHKEGLILETDLNFKTNPIFIKEFWKESSGDCASYDVISQQLKVEQCNYHNLMGICLFESYQLTLERYTCMNGFFYINSPKPTCLTKIQENNGTYNEQKLYCNEINGFLPKNGKVHLHNNFLWNNRSITSLPVDLFDTELSTNSRNAMVFDRNNVITEEVDENYIFDYVICEHVVKPTSIQLQTSNDSLIAILPDGVMHFEICCFTDSLSFYPKQVKFLYKGGDKILIKPTSDGYYWCTTKNIRHVVNDSEKTFWVKDKTVYRTMFAVYYHFASNNKTDYLFSMPNGLNSYLFENYYKMTFKYSRFFKSFLPVERHLKIRRIFMNQTVLFHMHIPNDHKLLNAFIEKRRSFKNLYPDVIEITNVTLCEKSDTARERSKCFDDFTYGQKLQSTAKSKIITIKEDLNEIIETQSLELFINVTKMTNEILKDKGIAVNEEADFLHILEDASNTVELKNGTMFQSMENIGIGIVDISKFSEIIAVRIENDNENNKISFLETDALKTLVENTTSTNVIVELSEVIVKNESNRITVFAINKNSIFGLNKENDTVKINSQIVSVSIPINDTFKSYIDIHFRPLKAHLEKNEYKYCAFWNLTSMNWSTHGCTLEEQSFEGFDKCRCTHLTHFAQLIGIKYNYAGEVNGAVLSYLTYIGCVLSLMGTIGIILTAILIDSWNKELGNKVYICLSVSFNLLSTVFLVNSYFGDTNNRTVCSLMGAAMHYSVLAAFCWMLVSAFSAYQKLVIVFHANTSHKLLKANLFSWLIPLPFVVLILFFNYNDYTITENKEVNNAFCYPSGLAFWLTIFTPVITIVILNFLVFLKIIHALFFQKTIQKEMNVKDLKIRVKVSILIFVVFGLTWSFGFLSYFVLFNYIFCATASSQGFILFIFVIIGNKNTRNNWIKKVSRNSSTGEDWLKKLNSTDNKSTDNFAENKGWRCYLFRNRKFAGNNDVKYLKNNDSVNLGNLTLVDTFTSEATNTQEFSQTGNCSKDQ